MKFTEFIRTNNFLESNNSSEIIVEEKLASPKAGNNEEWYELYKREMDRINVILASNYEDSFTSKNVTIDDNGTAHASNEKPTGACAVVLDDDCFYFELVFNASDSKAFDTAMDIIEDYKKIVHFPNPNAYIFESISNDDNELNNFFRFTSWCDSHDATTPEGFMEFCDWLDRIKRMCISCLDYPEDVILKRVELNNTWSELFNKRIDKSSAENITKKATEWSNALSRFKGEDYLKGNKID